MSFNVLCRLFFLLEPTIHARTCIVVLPSHKKTKFYLEQLDTHRLFIISLAVATRSCIRNFQRLPTKKRDEARKTFHALFSPIFLLHLLVHHLVPVGTVSLESDEKINGPAVSFPIRHCNEIRWPNNGENSNGGRLCLELWTFRFFRVIVQNSLAAAMFDRLLIDHAPVSLCDPVIGNRAVCSRYCQQRAENVEDFESNRSLLSMCLYRTWLQSHRFVVSVWRTRSSTSNQIDTNVSMFRINDTYFQLMVAIGNSWDYIKLIW